MRSRLSRSLIVAVILSLVALSLFACGEASEEPTTSAPASSDTPAVTPDVEAEGPAEPIKIAFFSYNPSPLPAVVYTAIQDKAAEIGNIEAVLFQGTGDGKAQETQMRDAIQTGEYAGFILQANDGLRLQPVVLEAQEKGIVTVCLDATLDDPRKSIDLENRPGVAQTIGYPYKQGAQIFFDAIVGALEAKNSKPEGIVAIMPGMTNFPADAIRMDLVSELATAKGGIEIVIMPQGDYNTSSAQRAALDFLQSRKDIDVIMSFGDQMTQGIEVALGQVGLKAGEDVYLVAQGGSKEAVEKIKAGTWFASQRNYPYTEGVLAVQTIVDVLAGKTVEEVISNFDISPNVVSAETLAEYPDFEAEWSTSAE